MIEDRRVMAMSRRQMVGGAIGACVAAAGPTIAQDADRPDRRSNSELKMENPVSKYPRPPFRKQTQPWPGLARDMDPKPDHGENTYFGSGRLTGRKALITGGDSGMGRAAAIAYAREGADVAINYLPSEEPDAREVITIRLGDLELMALRPLSTSGAVFAGLPCDERLIGLGTVRRARCVPCANRRQRHF